MRVPGGCPDQSCRTRLPQVCGVAGVQLELGVSQECAGCLLRSHTSSCTPDPQKWCLLFPSRASPGCGEKGQRGLAPWEPLASGS